MKALVLAGGSGTRLRPITHTFAKQLVPVANKPVLFYGLESIAEAGITDVGIIVGRTAPEIRAAVKDGSALGLTVTYLPQEAPLGLAHAVLTAQDFLGDDDFVMYLGDNFVSDGIAPLVEKFRRDRPDADILLTRVPNPEAFGAVELDEAGQVLGLAEKPEFPKSDLALVGIYLFTPAIHAAVREITPSARGELEITDAIQWLIDRGFTVRPTMTSGYWKDVGNAAELLEANRWVLEHTKPAMHGTVDADCELTGPVRIEPGAEVRGSRIVGPAVIGAGTRIHRSRIGPFTSIADHVTVEDSDIEYSIVLAGSVITGVRPIEASLIGRDVKITPTARRPTAAHRLTLGDHSEVQIPS